MINKGDETWPCNDFRFEVSGNLMWWSEFCLHHIYLFPIPGLPPTGSWQDLKDHMREAGDVCFADVQRDGEGVVEFLRREDMEYALRRLDRTEFRSHQVSSSADEIFPFIFFCCLKK